MTSEHDHYFLNDGIATDEEAAHLENENSGKLDSNFDSETILPVGEVGSSTSVPYYISYSTEFVVQIHYRPIEEVLEVLDLARQHLEVFVLRKVQQT